MHGCIMLGMDWQDRPAETDRLDRLANRREGGFAATLLAVVGGEPE